MNYTRRDTREYGHGTSITSIMPFGVYITANVMCSDGKVRKVTRISETADTFFSVPASVRVRGKHVSGYITTESATGFSASYEESDSIVVKFVAVQYGKNHAMLPPGKPMLDFATGKFTGNVAACPCSTCRDEVPR